MTKYLAIACAALLLALAGTGYALKRAIGEVAVANEAVHAANVALERASKAAKADRALVTRTQAQKAATAREMARLRLNLEAALAANRAWADAPIPQEVQDALAP